MLTPYLMQLVKYVAAKGYLPHSLRARTQYPSSEQRSLQCFDLSRYTLENHCTRIAKSPRSGCSQRVHKLVYLFVNKGNILVIFYIKNIHRELLSLINPAMCLQNTFFVG